MRPQLDKDIQLVLHLAGYDLEKITDRDIALADHVLMQENMDVKKASDRMYRLRKP